MPQKIRLAFQGGGARLAALLAAGEAFLDAQSEGKIEITQTAGTSAGAVVAALVARQANIAALRGFLRTVDRSVIGSAFPVLSGINLIQKARIGFRLLWRERPLIEEAALSKLFAQSLEFAGISRDAKIGIQEKENSHSCLKPCYIVATDLTTKSRLIFKNTDPLLQALVNSCALPFVYRMPRGLGNSTVVDGGILDNLPVEALLDNEVPQKDEGEIIAIVFPERAYAAPAPGALSFAGSLLDAAMTSKTRATKRLIDPKNVFEIDTDIETFEIGKFQNPGLEDIHYDAVKRETKNRLESWLRAKARNDALIKRGTAAYSAYLEEKIRTISNIFWSHAEVDFLERKLEVTAHSLLPKLHPMADAEDVVKSILKFQPRDVPLTCLEMGIMSTNAGILDQIDHNVFDAEKKGVKIVAVPTTDDRRKRQRTLIVFDPPLPPRGGVKGPYTLVLTQRVAWFMRPLADNGRDYLAVRASSGGVDTIDIILFVPKTFARLELTQGDEEALAGIPHEDLLGQGDALARGGKAAIEVEGCPVGFVPYVWQAKEVAKGHVVRVVYHTIGVPMAT